MNDNLIPVLNSVNELEDFLQKNKEKYFCLYLAYKDNEGWQKSTSRRYMNQVFVNLIYLPVNVEKQDYDSLKKVYEITENNPKIIAINQTQPHKSNPVIMHWFENLPNKPTNIDALIKDENGKLLPLDLNGPSFVSWFQDEVETLVDKTIILIGVGGAGEPIVREIVKHKPARIVLIDPIEKSYLVTQLNNYETKVEYHPDFQKLGVMPDYEKVILINAAGKEGTGDDSGIYSLLEKYKDNNFIFVDLRPQLEIDIVIKAKQLGWQAFTGHGMNARNDYELLSRVAHLINRHPLTFNEFKNLVVRAS